MVGNLGNMGFTETILRHVFTNASQVSAFVLVVTPLGNNVENARRLTI